jgi:hypothetical protein
MTDPGETKRRALEHDRAVGDWLEAEGIVVALRRSAAAAAERAAERARAAELLERGGRSDAFALGVADAARVLAQRAAAEARRLESALREEERLRARAAAARRALAEVPVVSPGAGPGRRGARRCA